jgi:isochorismate pyruvate lyase
MAGRKPHTPIAGDARRIGPLKGSNRNCRIALPHHRRAGLSPGPADRGLPMKPCLFVVAVLLVSALGPTAAQSAEKPADPPAYWGSPSIDGGKCCASLAEVRANIDRLDRQIIRLMAERGRYVAEAGRFKANPAAVSAPARVEAVIAGVKAVAREEGLAESVAERSYRAMISAFEDFEREEWTRGHAAGAAQ